ncbi:MAG TPA: DUF3119 family protein [Candidatus Obscuribacterales bacterium]
MTAASSTTESTTLPPSYTIPLTLIGAGLVGGVAAIALTVTPLLWGAGVAAVFGLFLLYQAATLRLVFTATDLDVYRGAQRIRRFPYGEWATWEIFWSPVPILFYFREVNSIHFLPILFDPAALRSQLERHVPPPAAAP